MKFKHLHAFVAIMVGVLLASCHSDIDLANIDKKAEVEMGLVLPIGKIHMKVGDFLGKGKINHLFVENGLFVLKLDTPITREYSKFELKRYLPDVNMPLLDVYEALPTPDMGGYKVIPGTGTDVKIPFPLTLKLDGINHPDSVGKQRLDSALIDSASFVSTINLNNMTMNWDYVQRIVLNLGDRVHPENGSTSMLIYEKNNPAFAQYTSFGQNMDTRLRDFSIVLMKNLHPSSLPDYLNNNVVDSLIFTVDFVVNIPVGDNITVNPGSGFNYHMTVQFLDYKAIWGMFSPSDEMSDENVIDISNSWKDLKFLTRASLPFAEPKVDIDITTKIAGALRIRDAYLFTIDNQDVRHDAAFGPNEYKTKTINFEDDEYLPLSSAIGDSTTNMWVHFDKTPEGGRLNRLFQNIPNKLGYRFNVEFNAQTTPQIRVIPDVSIRVNAHTSLPLVFGEGMHLDYTDTIKDVKLSQYSIDSLAAKAKVIDTIKTSDVTLLLTAYNTIPMDVHAVFRCLNEKGDTIMDPEDPTRPMSLFAEDTLTFVAPHYQYVGGNWQRTDDGKTVCTAKLSAKKLNMLPQVKNIVYKAVLDNKTLQDEFDADKGFTAKVTDDAGVTLKIGLTAQADVVLTLNNE